MMSELNKLPNKNPFRVPDGYFEDVTMRIMLAASKTPQEPVIEKKTFRIRPWMAVAAGFALIAALSITALLVGPGRPETDPYSQLSYNGNYEEIFYGMDISVIEEEAAGRITSGLFADVDNSDIIEYLLMQNINILEIYEYF